MRALQALWSSTDAAARSAQGRSLDHSQVTACPNNVTQYQHRVLLVRVHLERLRHQELTNGGTFSASPVLVGDTILVTSEEGISHLFRATPEGFESLGENSLGDQVFASPAVCDGRLYFRVADFEGDVRRERLVCVGAGS
ncbi:hypothetical protein EBU58_02685 [bacterium]|nr:hypothetical protein [bacterium]